MKLNDATWQRMSRTHYGAVATRKEVEAEIASWPEPYPVEQEAGGDVVEKMGCAVWADGMDSYASRRVRITAALAVARQHFAAHPLEEWLDIALEPLTNEEYQAVSPGFGTCNDFTRRSCNLAFANRRARLTPPKQPAPDPAVEAVKALLDKPVEWQTYGDQAQAIVAAVRKADQGETR